MGLHWTDTMDTTDSMETMGIREGIKENGEMGMGDGEEEEVGDGGWGPW